MKKEAAAQRQTTDRNRGAATGLATFYQYNQTPESSGISVSAVAEEGERAGDSVYANDLAVAESKYSRLLR